MIKKVIGIYFSPAGSTKEIITHMTKTLAQQLNVLYELHSYTMPDERNQRFIFANTDLVLWGTPVYAGRIPNKTLDYVQSAMEGNCTCAIPVVVYGNRSFDNALAELNHILEKNGCHSIAAAAVIARHSFSHVLAAGRPDEEDFDQIDAFCEKVVVRLQEDSLNMNDISLHIPGEAEPTAYYVPKKMDGTPAKFLKAKPKVDDHLCSKCGKCLTVCPMGSINCSEEGRPIFDKICIKCQACVRTCPCQAIYMDDEDFLSHKKMVEENFGERKEARFFF